MERVEKDLEEKKQKEEEKLERKRQREEKKKHKEKSKGKSKKRKTTSNTITCTDATTVERQSRAMCRECEMYFDIDEGEETWIECETCLNWFHALCVGVIELDDETQFTCDLCN